MDPEALKHALQARHIGAVDGRAPCAVLVPLVKENGEWCLLYEKRAAGLKLQPGEVCFPGGHIEYGEPTLSCALRETREELGIKSEYIDVLGSMDYIIHYIGFPVYPFAAVLKDGWKEQLNINRDEVERVFTIPLSYLRAHPADQIRTAKRHLTLDSSVPAQYRDYIEGPARPDRLPLLFWPYEDIVLWGMTARLTQWLLDFMEGMHEV